MILKFPSIPKHSTPLDTKEEISGRICQGTQGLHKLRFPSAVQTLGAHSQAPKA